MSQQSGLVSVLARRRFAALVLVAVLVGAYLRFAALTEVPPALNQDEAVNGYDAYSLFLTGRDHLGHPFPFAGLESFGDWASPLLTFITAPAVGVFGLNVAVIRGVSATMGLAAIPLVYLLAWQLFERRSIAILAAWVLALSPWAIELSRWAIPVAAVPAMLCLTMLTTVWTLRRSSARGAVATGIAAGLTVMSYPTMKLYIPLLLLAALIVYRRAVMRINREVLIYAAICFAVIAGPVIVLSTIDPGGRARLDQVSIFRQAGAGPVLLFQQYLSYFSPGFLFSSGDGDPMHSPPGFGVEVATLSPFLLAGIFWLLYCALQPLWLMTRSRSLRIASDAGQSAKEASTSGWLQLNSMFLLAAVLLYPVPGSLTLPNPQTLRAAHLIPLNTIIAAVGAVAIWDIASRLLAPAPAVARRVALAGLIFAAAIPIHNEVHSRYGNYFDEYPAAVAPFFQYGLQQALEYAQANLNNYDEIWVTDTNQPYIYTLFFNRVSPNDVHTTLQVTRHPPEFNQVYSFGKYRFLGLPPGVNAGDLPVLLTIPEPDGTVAYQVRGGKVADGRRVMLIER